MDSKNRYLETVNTKFVDKPEDYRKRAGSLLAEYFSAYPEAMSRSVVEQDIIYKFTGVDGDMAMIKEEAGSGSSEAAEYNGKFIQENGEKIEVESITAEEAKDLLQ